MATSLSPRPLRFSKTMSPARDRKSTRLNSSHRCISYAVFCLKKKTVAEVDRPLVRHAEGPAAHALEHVAKGVLARAVATSEGGCVMSHALGESGPVRVRPGLGLRVPPCDSRATTTVMACLVLACRYSLLVRSPSVRADSRVPPAIALYLWGKSNLSSARAFFFNDPATTEIYTLSLHDALPIFWPTSYDWDFIPVAGGTFSDHGSALCHSGAPLPNQAPIANPGGPYGSEGTVTLDGGQSRDPEIGRAHV